MLISFILHSFTLCDMLRVFSDHITCLIIPIRHKKKCTISTTPCLLEVHEVNLLPGLELQILRGTQFQGHSRRAPKATVLKNTIEEQGIKAKSEGIYGHGLRVIRTLLVAQRHMYRLLIMCSALMCAVLTAPKCIHPCWLCGTPTCNKFTLYLHCRSLQHFVKLCK